MHLNTIKCCNHAFTASDIKGKLLSQREVFHKEEDPHLYGGNVKRFAPTQCPECRTSYHLWLKPNGQTWKVLTISLMESPETVETNVFDRMDKPQLREWLDSNHIEYVPQWGEERLRELCKSYPVA